jgi:transposase InsO family protein
MQGFDEEKQVGEVRPESGEDHDDLVRRRREAAIEGAKDRVSHNAAQRLMLLDMAMKSGLPMKEFAELVGVSLHTLYAWKKRYDEGGPAGLMDQPRKHKEAESRLPELVKKAIVMLKQANPEYGCERISDMLGRSDGYSASPGTVLRVIREAGLEVASPPVPAHGVEPKRFERARPNQLWQTDIFTFLLKRENRRVYMVVFLDDHSRYVVGYGIHAAMGGLLVVETLRAAIAAYGAPEEVLTDNGPQYRTWRGKSRFTKEMEKLGIRHILARPKHPQTVGKAERFWGTLWRECVEKAVFIDVEDARKRVGHFIDYYNFQRPHQGIEGMVPADRFFGAQDEVRKTLQARVAQNALTLAKNGAPRKPFYLTGRVGDVGLSIHAEGERVVLNTADGRREEIDLRVPGRRVTEGEQAEVLPEPVAVSGTVSESELDDDLNPTGATEPRYEEDADGRYQEAATEEDEGHDNGERGGAEGDGGGAGGPQRGAGDAVGDGGAGDLVDEVLHAGGAGAAGDGDGVGAAAAGSACTEAGGRAGESGEGARTSEAGGGAHADAFAAGAEERKAAGTGEREEEQREAAPQGDGARGQDAGAAETRG